MKKVFMILVLNGSFLFSQTGKVGINSPTPTETLHVNGTERVGNLPLNGATNAIYTKADGTVSTAKDQTFKATRTVVADANGVLGVVSGLPNTTPADPIGGFTPSSGTKTTTVLGGVTSTNFTDALEVKSGCLKFMLDPNNGLLYSFGDVYLALDTSNPLCGTSSYAAVSVAGGTSISTNETDYWRGTLNGTYQKINGFESANADTPLRFGQVALFDLKQGYEIQYNGVNNNPTTIGSYLERLY